MHCLMDAMEKFHQFHLADIYNKQRINMVQLNNKLTRIFETRATTTHNYNLSQQIMNCQTVFLYY